MNNFVDIKITSLDEEASGASGVGSFMNVVFRLSQCAPMKWVNSFNQNWQEHSYMMKHNVDIIGYQLTIHCMNDEVQNLLYELKNVVWKTNTTYKSCLDSMRQAEDAVNDLAKQQRDELAKLKKKLKF